MKRFKDFTETTTGTSSSMVPQWLHKIAMKPKLKSMVRMYLDWRKKNPGKGRAGVQQAVKMMGLSPRDGNLLVDTLNDMIKKGQMPKHLAVENYLPDEGTDNARKHAKKMTPGEVEEGMRGSTDAPKGPESYEAQYKRRLVKTTDPEHKKKGFNWRIKGKKNSSLTKKLYKNKPGQAEFNKQMRRIAGHEFG